jgi:hypothetical protein
MKKNLIPFIFLAVLLSGCSVYQINSKDTSEGYYVPKTSVDDVAYIEKVDKEYTEIAVVSVTTERRQSFADVLPKLKQEAGMLGADAITDVKSEPTDLWKSLKPQRFLSNAYIRTVYSAKAIVWK